MSNLAEYDVYTNAVKKFGVDAQLDMLIEEAAEVIQAVSHYRRGRCDEAHVVGELADLQVMIYQTHVIFGHDVVMKMVHDKTEALKEKLDIEKFIYNNTYYTQYRR